VEQMNQTNQRLYGMVQNFLQAAKIDQGRLTISKTAFPIEEAIDQAAGILAIRARNKKIELRWPRPEQPLPAVFGDRVHVIQIMLNLLTNAIKYTHEHGRVTVTAAASDRMSPDGQAGRFIEVAVSDTGRGIAPEDQEKIFERFYRSADVIKDDIEGTGLGLYIVRGLVDLHGGRVWVESQPGSGTTFRFTLPAAEDDK
jgi:signal transduction histidine kinase